MSNKNLKVFKMLFLTQLRKLTMNVKFSCKIKVTWKRSNESSQSEWIPLQSGSALFNQTLKLKANMYFDTDKNKFVEKKCLYSFVISTDKGDKAAGNVTIDLGDLLNRKIFEMDQSFTLEKCPVAGTKIDMKIYYEEDATEQQGYDSMSCISATNALDSSVASMDLSELGPTKSNLSQKSQGQTQKSQKSDLSTSKTEKEVFKVKQEQNYVKLDSSDVMEYSQPQSSSNSVNKIGQNIKSLNHLTTKINTFVTDKSKNIRYQIQSLKQKTNSLEEQLQAQKNQKERIEGLLSEQKKKNGVLQRQFNDFKVQTESKFQDEERKRVDLDRKYQNAQDLVNKMQSKMSESGQSQNSYISQLKQNSSATQNKLSQQIDTLRESLVQQKRVKNNLSSKIQESQAEIKDLRQRYTLAIEKNATMEDDMHRKEQQLEATRINLERTYEHLMTSLNGIL